MTLQYPAAAGPKTTRPKTTSALALLPWRMSRTLDVSRPARVEVQPLSLWAAWPLVWEYAFSLMMTQRLLSTRLLRLGERRPSCTSPRRRRRRILQIVGRGCALVPACAPLEGSLVASTMRAQGHMIVSTRRSLRPAATTAPCGARTCLVPTRRIVAVLAPSAQGRGLGALPVQCRAAHRQPRQLTAGLCCSVSAPPTRRAHRRLACTV